MSGRTILLLALGAGLLQGCAPIEHTQSLAQPVGQRLTVPVGGTIATINKQKNLPNAFGASDIYGRKVDTGLIKLVYMGPSQDGGVVVRQVDVDVHSNASVFTRSPGMAFANSNSSISGTATATGATVTGASYGSAHAFTPHAETNIVLPPNVTQFVVPKGETMTLASGEVIEFIDVRPHQVGYRIVRSAGNRR